MWVQTQDFSVAQLARFTELQRQVYAALEVVSQTLKVGETEREVAKRIHRALKPMGLQSYFHVPVALFGERTAYPGDFGPFESLSTGHRLADDDAVILDCAPVIDGYTIDCSYSVPRADRVTHAQADGLLRRWRDHILARAKNSSQYA